MKTYNFYQQTIIDAIDFDGYGIETPQNDREKVIQLYNIFTSEYKGAHNKHLRDEIIFKDWLMGLPSSCTVPFYNHVILENAKKAGLNLVTTYQEDQFLDRYWANLSKAYFNLKNNL